MNILTETSTLELIDEIAKRCEPCIIAGKKNEGADDGGEHVFYEHLGSDATCYGLCHELAFQILKSMIKKELIGDT